MAKIEGNGKILNREIENKILSMYHMSGMFIWVIADLLNIEEPDVEAVIRAY